MTGSIWNLSVCNIRNVKISINMSLPLFMGAIFIISVIKNNQPELGLVHCLAFLLALFLHDLGHIIIARRKSIDLQEILILPFGSRFKFSELNQVDRNIYVLPIFCSLILAFLLQINLPAEVLEDPLSSESFLLYLCLYSYSLAFLNMLPIYPLDAFFFLENTLAKSSQAKSKISKLSVIISCMLLLFMLGTNNLAGVIITTTLFVFSIQSNDENKIQTAISDLQLSDVVIPKENLVCLSSLISNHEALKTCVNSFQDYFPVLHEDQAIGIVSKSDLLRSITFKDRQYLNSITDKSIEKVQITLSLNEVYKKLAESKGILLVYEGEEFRGIVTKDKIKENSMYQAILNDAEKDNFLDL